MFLMVGERVREKREPIGELNCAVCSMATAFTSIIEQNYFTLFAIPLLPLDKTAEYVRCDKCHTVYRVDDQSEPASLLVGKWVLVYIMLGYGMIEHRDTVRKIFKKVTGFEYLEADMRSHIREMESDGLTIMERLKQYSGSLDIDGKAQVLSLAYLMTYVSCEIQYEDRLRLNLMGNALDVSISFVESVIQHVRAQRYFGVRRLLKADLTRL